MITFKTVFGPHKRSDNTLSVRIRITKDRKVGYLTTPFSIHPEALNKKGELLTSIENKKLKAELDSRIDGYMNTVISMSSTLDGMTVNELIKKLSNPISNEEVNLFPYFRKKIEEFEATKAKGTCIGYTTAVNRLEMFINKNTKYPSEFTVRRLNDFEIHLRTGNTYI